MSELYKKVAENFLKGLRLYITNELTLDELRELEDIEKLVYNTKTWPAIKQELRNRIFTFYKKEHDGILNVDGATKQVKALYKKNRLVLNKGELLCSGHMLGRNRVPPKGYEGSGWYVPPYPTLEMLSMPSRNNSEEGEINSPAGEPTQLV